MVKRMPVGEHDVEMAWPLGMAFFGRNKSPFEERQAAVMHTFLPSAGPTRGVERLSGVVPVICCQGFFRGAPNVRFQGAYVV